MLSEKIKNVVFCPTSKPSARTCVKLPGGISGYDMIKLSLQGISEDNIYVYENIPLSEYRKISNKETLEILKLASEIALACTVLACISACAFASGKFDKQFNSIFTAKDNIFNKISNHLHLRTKAKINSTLDFTKARAHIHDVEKINAAKQISGAHEIRECIQTLLNKNGNIINIDKSKTNNGLFEFFYEIDGKLCDTPKTVYVKESLSDTDIKDLLSLSGKHGNRSLLKSLTELMNNKKSCNGNSITQSAEEALKNGYIVKSPDSEKEAKLTLKRIADLTKQLNAKKGSFTQVQEQFNKANGDFTTAKATIDHHSEEFQKKYQAFQSAKTQLDDLKREINSLQNKIEKAKKHHGNIENSVNIFGEKDGKLFGAFAHYKDSKLVVDSYFPITHGSKMQNMFVKYCLNKKNLAINDIKCLIGAEKSQINNYFDNLFTNFRNSFFTNNNFKKAYLIFLMLTSAKIVQQAKKISKERKTNAKINNNMN